MMPCRLPWLVAWLAFPASVVDRSVPFRVIAGAVSVPVKVGLAVGA